MLMKALVVYNSIAQGNTAKIAKVIARVLEAKLLKPNEISEEMVRECNLMGFGSGIYFQKHHRSLHTLVAQLSDVEGKKAFIFSTSGWGNTKYNEPFSRLLVARGFKVVGSFSCKGFDGYGFVKHLGGVNKGRPNEEELHKAEAFAENLKTAS